MGREGPSPRGSWSAEAPCCRPSRDRLPRGQDSSAGTTLKGEQGGGGGSRQAKGRQTRRLQGSQRGLQGSCRS